MTIASSTTKPTAMLRPISDRLSRLKPRTYITANVPMRARGTATLGMTVAQKSLKKTKITMTTSTIVNTRVNSTSRTEARMVVVRSLRIEI